MKLNLKLQNSILTHKLDFVLVRIILNKKLSKQDKTLTTISYCPTKEMSDYLSKPLQGSLFRIHRNAIGLDWKEL